jgi:type VI secretion system secreted protein Hcp
MPLTGYMKVPDIDGESTRVGHEDEIDIFAVSWDINAIAASGSSRRRRARADAGPLVVHKYYDAASPYLALATHQGKVFDEVAVTLRKESGGVHLDYLTITLRNVVISSYAFENDPWDEGEEQLTERVECEAEKISFKYVVQEEDHSAGDEHETEIDL